MNSRPDSDAGAAAAAIAVLVRRPSLMAASIVLLIALAVSGLSWPTLQSLNGEWRNTDNLTYTHGYLILAIAGWLILRSSSLPRARLAPDWRLVPALLVLSLCWLVTLRAGIELLHQLLWPILMFLAVCAAAGLRNGSRFWFPFAFLYFAVPAWSFGNDILQTLTVVAVRLMLQLTAVPAYVSGNIVHIPAGSFEIAGGCSGLHFFIVALSIAALYGEIYSDSFKARVKLLLLAAVLAVVTNWLRVYTIVVAGHLTDMQHYLVRVSHYYFGWGVFAVTMIAFFVIAGRMPAEGQSAGVVTRASSAASSALPKQLVIAVVAILAVLSIAPAWNGLWPAVSTATAAAQLLPRSAGAWSGPHETADSWQPSYPDSDRSARGEYRWQGRTATAFVAEYAYQRQGKELIGFTNSILGSMDGDWTQQPTMHGAGGENGLLLQHSPDGDASVVLYYYQVGSHRLVNGFAAQLRYGLASLFSRPVSRVAAVHAACTPDCETAAAGAQQLLDAIEPAGSAGSASQ